MDNFIQQPTIADVQQQLEMNVFPNDLREV